MRFIFTLTLLALIGCSKVADVREAQILGVGDVTNLQTKPIVLTKITAKIRRGTNVGNLYYKPFCSKATNFKWKSSRTHFHVLDDLESVFTDELEGNGYTVIGSGENLIFDGINISRAELLIAARILNVKINMCSPSSQPDINIHGSLFIEVEWQLFDPFQKEVVATINTEGSYKVEETVADGYKTLWDNAFAVATNNLIANKEFTSLSISKKTYDLDKKRDY